MDCHKCAHVLKKSRSAQARTVPIGGDLPLIEVIAVPTKRHPPLRRTSLTRAVNPAHDPRYMLARAVYEADQTAIIASVNMMHHVPQVAWSTLVHIVALTSHRRDAIATLTYLINLRVKHTEEDALTMLTACAAACSLVHKSTHSYEHFCAATLRAPVSPLHIELTPGAIDHVSFAQDACPYDVKAAFNSIYTELHRRQNISGAIQAAFAVIWADRQHKATASRDMRHDRGGRLFGKTIKAALGLDQFGWSTVVGAEQMVYAQLACIARGFQVPRLDVVELCRTAFSANGNSRFFNPYSVVVAIIVSLMVADGPDAGEAAAITQPLVQTVTSAKATLNLSPEDWILGDRCICDRRGTTALTILEKAQADYSATLTKLDDRLSTVLAPVWQAHFPRYADVNTPPVTDEDSYTQGSDHL